MKRLIMAFGLGLALLGPQFALGREVELYGPKGPVSDYDELVDTLQAGDLIHFASLSVRIGKPLHHPEHVGATSIFAVSHHWAIRIPRFAPRPGTDSESLMNSFFSEYFELKKHGAPVVNIDMELLQAPQFLMVARKYIRFTLEKWIMERLNKRSTAAEEKALIQFAERTAAWERIGDFGLRQVGYDGSEWVLMDWDKDSRLAQHIQDKTIWESVSTYKKLALHLDLHRKLIEAAQRTRRDQGLPSCADLLSPSLEFTEPKVDHSGIQTFDFTKHDYHKGRKVSRD